MLLPFNTFTDSNSVMVPVRRQSQPGGSRAAGSPLDVQISGKEISGVNYFPLVQNILIAAHDTKLYIRKKDSILQPNVMRLDSLCWIVELGGNTKWDY